MAAIEVEGLVKTYGGVNAVDGIDLTVEEGEILAFLGHNGAGKTTAIEILEGYRDRDAGTVRVLGVDPADASSDWREKIGIVLQESEPVPELTALESLQMQAGYYRNPRDPEEVLELVGLVGSGSQRTRKLSGGQKRRLDLGMALVGNPSLVFLDEPTTGFDPSARRESWHMIEALRDLGHTVLLTTHYMDEAEHLADRIVIIAGGSIVARGTAQQLTDQVDAPTRISWKPLAGSAAPPERLGWTIDRSGLAFIETADVMKVVHVLSSWSVEQGVDLPEFEVAGPTLEDVYLILSGNTEEYS